MGLTMDDENKSLIIKIEHKDYISLFDFKESIEGWNNQYNYFISQCGEDGKLDKLLIKEIRQGSIEIELTPALLPLLSDYNTVSTFFVSVKMLFNWLISKKGEKPKIETNDLANAKKIIAPVNNHTGTQITINGDNNGTMIINPTNAEAITKNVKEEYMALDRQDNSHEEAYNKEDVIFKLTQIKDDENPNKNTKGIIAEIDRKEHPVLFSNIEMKDKILQENSNPFHKNYLVNVKINKSGDEINSYAILDINDSYTDEEKSSLFL
jgi:hypothetical protein